MARDDLSLRRRREYRRGLIHFLSAVRLRVLAGHELAHAWETALSDETRALPGGLARQLERRNDETFGHVLQRLAQDYPGRMARSWFAALVELYAQGAALAEALGAFVETLRVEAANDLEAHLRALPARTNLVLLAFCFPVAALLLFFPLLLEILAAFPG